MKVLLLAQKVVLASGSVPPHGSGVHGAATLNGLRAHFDVLPVSAVEVPGPSGARTTGLRRRMPGWVRGLRQDLLALREDRRFTARALAAGREFGPDVVYARSEYMASGGVRVAAKLGVPLVLEVNGLLATDVRAIYRSPLEPVGRALERWKHRKADVVVAVSPGLARRLEEVDLDPAKVVIVPNSVSPDRVLVPRAQHGEAVVVGWIGHLMRWHLEALEWLIDLAPAIRAAVPGVRFLVIGSGPGLEGLIEKARLGGLADHFEFTGSVPYDEVPHRLQAADIGLIPEIFEYAFPVKLVDFGAAGIPLVAPRSASLDEQVVPGLEYEPFEPGDAEALVAAIARLASDAELRGRLAGALQKAVVERFTWSATGDTLAAAIEGMRAR